MAFSEKSVAFDGSNDYVTMGNVLSFERTDAFSISVWYKTTDTGWKSLVGKLEGSPNYRGWNMILSGSTAGRIRFQVVNGSGNRVAVETTATIYTDGTWRHAVATYDGSSSASGVTWYMEGIPVSMTTIEDTLSATVLNSVDLVLGANNNGAIDHIAGNLDEVAVYDKELSAAEVAWIFNEGIPRDLADVSAPSNLVGWWRMGDGDTYPTLSDNSGRADGTMTNMDAGDIVSEAPSPGFGGYVGDIGDVAHGSSFHSFPAYLAGEPAAVADTTPPTFAGVVSAVALSSTSARLTFNAATDDITDTDAIWYEVHWAYAPSASFDVRSSVVAADVLPVDWQMIEGPVECTFDVGDLKPGRTYYFRVRARDGSGNADANSIEVSLTTPADSAVPTIENVSPAPGTPILPTQTVQFDVLDTADDPYAESGFRRVIVHATFTDGAAEVVHNGEGFAGLYSAGSSRAAITNGYQYTLNRAGYWKTAPTFFVFAIDKEGNESGPLPIT